MKTLIASMFIFLSTSTITSAQCISTQGMRDKINEWGETTFFTGYKDEGVIYLLTVNPNTNAWSFIEVFSEGRACLRASGSDYILFREPPKGELN